MFENIICKDVLLNNKLFKMEVGIIINIPGK